MPPAPAPQVSELALLGCYRASRGLAQLSNLVQLDLQPGVVINGEQLRVATPPSSHYCKQWWLLHVEGRGPGLLHAF